MSYLFFFVLSPPWLEWSGGKGCGHSVSAHRVPWFPWASGALVCLKQQPTTLSPMPIAGVDPTRCWRCNATEVAWLPWDENNIQKWVPSRSLIHPSAITPDRIKKMHNCCDPNNQRYTDVALKFGSFIFLSMYFGVQRKQIPDIAVIVHHREEPSPVYLCPRLHQYTHSDQSHSFTYWSTWHPTQKSVKRRYHCHVIPSQPQLFAVFGVLRRPNTRLPCTMMWP